MTPLDPQFALTKERFAHHRQPEALRRRWLQEGLVDLSVVGPRLLDRLGQFPASTSVIDRDRELSNLELLTSANALAAAFQSAGIGRGHVVAWQTPNWWEATVVALATWQIGAINNPIVMIYREHELRQIFSELRPSVVIAPPQFRGIRHQEVIDAVLDDLGHQPLLRFGMRGGEGRWTDLTEVISRIVAPVHAEVELDSQDPCVVAYTSGTTSGAKGVVLDSEALLAETRQMRETWGMSWRDTSFMPAPLAHLTGLVVGVTMPITAGGTVVLQDQWDPGEAVELIERHGCVISSGAPTFLTDLVAAYDHAGLATSSLDQYSVGGSAVAPDLIERAEHLGLHAFRCYGMTEHLSTTIANKSLPLAIRRDTDGPVGPGSAVSAIDEDGRPLEPGVEGELRVRGPERMLGYVSEAHNEGVLDDAEGWFHTGDVGYVDDVGCVHVTGRRKDIINRGGEKFSAREIEDIISRHPDIHQSAVVPLPDPRLGEVPAAFVVLARGHEFPDPSALNAFLNTSGLARQKTPVQWHVVDAMPSTPFGKVKKHELIATLTAPDAED